MDVDYKFENGSGPVDETRMNAQAVETQSIIMGLIQRCATLAGELAATKAKLESLTEEKS